MSKEKNLELILQKYETALSKNLSELMKQKNVHESEIIKNSKEMGIPISAGSISDILNKKARPNLKTLIKLSLILDVTVYDLINDSNTTEKEKSSNLNNSVFVTDIQSRFFQRYLGQYHTYFFPTEETSQDKLLHGILEIGDFKENGTLKFTLNTKTNQDTIENSVKEYYGKVILSQPMEAIYCILEGIQQVEYSFLALHYQHLNVKDLSNRMVLALTVSSGSERRPTVHRVYLTKRKLNEEEKMIVMGMLRLNSLEITIPSNIYEKMINKENFSKKFSSFLNNHKNSVTCYTINIKELMNNSENLDMLQEGMALYKYISGNKYHKVLKEEDDILYKLFK